MPTITPNPRHDCKAVIDNLRDYSITIVCARVGGSGMCVLQLHSFVALLAQHLIPFHTNRVCSGVCVCAIASECDASVYQFSGNQVPSAAPAVCLLLLLLLMALPRRLSDTRTQTQAHRSINHFRLTIAPTHQTPSPSCRPVVVRDFHLQHGCACVGRRLRRCVRLCCVAQHMYNVSSDRSAGRAGPTSATG